MDFQLTEEQRLVQETARDFVDRELIPHVREWEAKGEVPKAFYRKMADLGFLGAPVPEKYGGGGKDYAPFILLLGEPRRGAPPGRATGLGLNPPHRDPPLGVWSGGPQTGGLPPPPPHQESQA